MVREKTSGVLVMFMEPNPDAERRNNCVPVASLSRVQISLEAGSKNAGKTSPQRGQSHSTEDRAIALHMADLGFISSSASHWSPHQHCQEWSLSREPGISPEHSREKTNKNKKSGPQRCSLEKFVPHSS